MHATTVAVDLAKSVFQVAVADDNWKVVEQHRLTRLQFQRWFENRDVGVVIMEACGSAHHWARWLAGRGIEARLLPAAYIRAYVKRNKTDAADACALLEAARCADIEPVRIKSVEQQALQGLHRTHGARSVLRMASLAIQAGRKLDGLRVWAVRVQGRTNHNKATCALANKLSRICYAVLRDGSPYGQPVVRPNKKLARTAFAMAA